MPTYYDITNTGFSALRWMSVNYVEKHLKQPVLPFALPKTPYCTFHTTPNALAGAYDGMISSIRSIG